MSRTDAIFSKRAPDKTHLTIQKSLLSFLPQGKLEHHFPSINRIADVVLLSQKIIFEIQCSPISLEEVQNRIRDYESLGFKVIWILHHHKFNLEIASPAEIYLRRHLSYFTSITRYGHGFFYDQLEFFDGLRRVYKGPPLILENFLPSSLARIPQTFPKILKEKLVHTPFYLPGDLTDHLLKKPGSNWAQILEKNYSPTLLKKSLALFRDFFLYLLNLNASRQHPFSAHTPLAKKNKETPLSTKQNRFPT